MPTFTVRDLVHRYGVHEYTVLGWIHAGELKAINVGTKPGRKKPRWRITQEALNAFEALRMATPEQQPTRQRRRKSGSDKELVDYVG